MYYAALRNGLLLLVALLGGWCNIQSYY